MSEILYRNFDGSIKELFPQGKKLYVVDENVYAIYSDMFSSLSFNEMIYIVSSGEDSKSAANLSEIYDVLLDHSFTRSDYIVAVGGGVAGDLAGYAAATYMRGIRFVNVPTTMISMIDSAIGGKTGINYRGFKNMIGSFYEPLAVIVDINFLSTLEDKHFKSGMAELVKIAAISDSDLYARLQREYLSPCHPELLAFIKRAQSLKLAVCSSDFRDQSERAKLNFGHSFGHAIETYFEFQGITHGQAVAKGMLIISKIAENVGLAKEGVYEDLRKTLLFQGLDVEVDVDVRDLLPYVLRDKKSSGDKMKFVIVDAIGSSIIEHVELDKLGDFVESYYA